MTRAAALLLVGGSLLWAAPIEAAPVRSTKAACAAVKVRFAAANHVPQSTIAFCDISVSAPPDFFVLALHGSRVCDGICSTNMGWFAIRKSDGQVFDWDGAEEKLGQPI